VDKNVASNIGQTKNNPVPATAETELFSLYAPYFLFFNYIPVTTFYFRSMVIACPEPKFYHISLEQSAGTRQGQIADQDLGIKIKGIGFNMIVAPKQTAKGAIDIIGKIPFGNKLIVGIGVC
jgi:hypothetical protein